MRGSSVELGYLVRARGRDRGAVVLLHDVWGLYDHFRELADRLADAGFSTLALELYRGRSDLPVKDAGAFMRELSDPDVLADVQRGVDLLRQSGPSTPTPPRVAVMGFCMGGMYALLAGARVEHVAAVVPFYGILSHAHGLLHAPEGLDASKKPESPLMAAGELRAPLLAFYGDRDPYVPTSDIDALRQRVSHAPVPCRVRVFEGAGHAFMNDTRPQAYAPEPARIAWQETLAFLGEQLDRSG